ncbi:hypothetical protein B566_EDAN010295 [Ephemera danica]|nr:hypothetical protein B566_EDAN010295 [Ephemera danica]
MEETREKAVKQIPIPPLQQQQQATLPATVPGLIPLQRSTFSSPAIHAQQSRQTHPLHPQETHALKTGPDAGAFTQWLLKKYLSPQHPLQKQTTSQQQQRPTETRPESPLPIITEPSDSNCSYSFSEPHTFSESSPRSNYIANGNSSATGEYVKKHEIYISESANSEYSGESSHEDHSQISSDSASHDSVVYSSANYTSSSHTTESSDMKHNGEIVSSEYSSESSINKKQKKKDVEYSCEDSSNSDKYNEDSEDISDEDSEESSRSSL